MSNFDLAVFAFCPSTILPFACLVLSLSPLAFLVILTVIAGSSVELFSVTINEALSLRSSVAVIEVKVKVLI